MSERYITLKHWSLSVDMQNISFQLFRFPHFTPSQNSVLQKKKVDFGVLTEFRRAYSYVTGTYRNVLVSNVNI